MADVDANARSGAALLKLASDVVDSDEWMARVISEVRDAQGRYIAPPQPTTPARPRGPWDENGKVEP